MKLTELIEKLQAYKKEIKAGCSHPQDCWDNVDFILVNDKNFNQENYYTEVDFEILEDVIAYNVDYMSGCNCNSGLTLVLRKQEEDVENEKTRD